MLRSPWPAVLLSKNVGAAEAFLEEEKNGFSFEAENTEELQELLKKIIYLSDEELLKMSVKSHDLAQKINSVDWAKTITTIIDERNKK